MYREVELINPDSPIRSLLTHGWGNGYVAVFKGHPWYGLHYDGLHRYIDTDSSLTFSQYLMVKHPRHLRSSLKKAWVIGFDTAHARDTLENWPHERVVENCFKILDQAKEACKFDR